MTMSRWIVFAGITAMLVTGYFATFASEGEGPLRSIRHVPADLQRQVSSALVANGLGWADVKMDGQRAMLNGVAPSELDREDAIETARRAAGQGGALWGGITSVDGSRLSIAPPRKPYQWSAVRGAGLRVRMSGAVPSQKFKRDIAREARKLFPQGVEDGTRVASGYPTGDWMGSVVVGLRQLRRLQAGELQFNDGDMVLLGQVADDGEKNAIETALSDIPKPLSASAQLTLNDGSTLPLPAAPDEAALSPDPEPEAATANGADCQKLIDAAMRNNVVLFQAGSVTVDATGESVVSGMVRTASLCPELKLSITGHADGTPAEANAGDISRRRAFAVAKILWDAGIARDRVAAMGAGDAQPAQAGDPVANRRVEFSVVP
jgi:outer membrane protein OmpA-like peptidoglycan-associated protein